MPLQHLKCTQGFLLLFKMTKDLKIHSKNLGVDNNNLIFEKFEIQPFSKNSNNNFLRNTWTSRQYIWQSIHLLVNFQIFK